MSDETATAYAWQIRLSETRVPRRGWEVWPVLVLETEDGKPLAELPLGQEAQYVDEATDLAHDLLTSWRAARDRRFQLNAEEHARRRPRASTD